MQLRALRGRPRSLYIYTETLTHAQLPCSSCVPSVGGNGAPIPNSRVAGLLRASRHVVRLQRRPRPPEQGGVDRDGEGVPVPVPPQGRRRLPRAGLLRLRRLPPRRRLLPGVRRRRQPDHAAARGGGVPGADLPRDDRRVGDGARRALRVGPLLQGGDQAAHQLLRRHQHAVALRRRQVVPRPRAHPALMELQLRPGGQGAGLRRAGAAGAGGERRGVGVQDGALVLDDAAAAQAVVPRRDGGAVPAERGGRHGEPDGRVRAHHQHHQRRDRVRQEQRHAGGRPDRLLPPVLQGPRRQARRAKLGLCSTEALRLFLARCAV